jgi:hypothetical protein
MLVVMFAHLHWGVVDDDVADDGGSGGAGGIVDVA